MALPNFPVDHTAPRPTGSGIDPKTVKTVLLTLGIVGLVVVVLAVANVLATTLKERVTDPAVDKTVETIDSGIADIAAIPAKKQAEAELAESLAIMYSDAQGLTQDQVELRSVSKSFFLANTEDISDEAIPWEDADSIELYYFTVSTPRGQWITAVWRYPTDTGWSQTTRALGH